MVLAEQMIEGLRLMGIGMGIVFAFLILLVVLLRWMSFVALRLAPAAPATLPEPAPATTSDIPDQALVAVITAAVHRYRRARREQGL